MPPKSVRSFALSIRTAAADFTHRCRKDTLLGVEPHELWDAVAADADHFPRPVEQPQAQHEREPRQD